MYKLTVRLSNYPSPLSPVIISDGFIEKEIEVDNIHNHDDILIKVEKLVENIDNRDEGTITIEVSDMSGLILLSGSVQNGSFSGVFHS